jgi:hypothetical protein
MVKVVFRKNASGKFIATSKIPTYRKNFHITVNNDGPHATMYNNTNMNYPNFKSYHYIPKANDFTVFIRNRLKNGNKKQLNTRTINSRIRTNLKNFYEQYLSYKASQSKAPPMVPRSMLVKKK